MENKNPIQVADRLFGALELLAENGSAAVSEVSDALGLNKTTAHRVLTSLVYMGYARQNEESGRYEPSLKIVGLSNKIMNHLDIVQIVRPYLRKLMEMTDETVHFVERDGIDAVYIDKLENQSRVLRMYSQVGKRIPVFCSAIGKAMVAWLDDTALQKIVDNIRFEKKTPYTLTDKGTFLDNLKQIRTCGYAVDFEDMIDEIKREVNRLDRVVNVVPLDTILNRIGFPSNWYDIKDAK